MTVRERIEKIASLLTLTDQDNDRLELDIRFYADGHVSISSPHGKPGEALPRSDISSGLVAVQQIVELAYRNARVARKARAA